MQHISKRWLPIIAGAVLLSLVAAHGNDGDMQMKDGGTPAESSGDPSLPSYFQYGEHFGLLFAHILLMTVAWVFILPVGVMFSISRTRYTLPVQFLFLALNGLGVFLITIYDASTPDLYPNNVHHKLGWVLTWVVGAQVLMGVITTYAKRADIASHTAQNGYIPVSVEAMAEHQRNQILTQDEEYRFSNDSGQGTEPNTESLRSQSVSSKEGASGDDVQGQKDEEDQEERHGLLPRGKVDRFLNSKIPRLFSLRALRALQILYNVIDRLIMLLGFVAMLSGIVTYGGLFMGDRIFSGMAHFIKGGVFFWFGILSLGRWAGCFADIGWAWNVKHTNSKWPSSEFVECFLIFFYGATNVFLEHLAAWGGEWSAQDFEHISITIMFIGGGMCGMLIESSRIRDLLIQQPPKLQPHKHDIQTPKSYHISMNPVPALIIMLLGTMMSSHHQESMFSTMVHKQWGTLLVGASFARAATYVIFYLSPPTSILPGRPPTELITAFCLMAGGAIFMASARDCVMTMESYGLEAMFVFTVATGLIMFLMAWIIAVIAIKGWAIRREARRVTKTDYRTEGMV